MVDRSASRYAGAVEQLTAALLEHGYWVVFAIVFIDQVGFPLPALPVVVAAGGLVGTGHLDPIATLAVVMLAALPGDWILYELGRRHGHRVVRTLCRIALEPDSCVRSTQGIFARHGARSLLVAKWVPGLQTMAPPLAGAAHMRRLPFFAYATAGTAIWGAVLIGMGYGLHEQLAAIGAMLAELGWFAAVLLVGGLALYLALKAIQRRRFMLNLRGARISALELSELLAGEEPVEVVDLRHAVDFASDPYSIPGARRIDPEEIEYHEAEIPRDRDIVLYCT